MRKQMSNEDLDLLAAIIYGESAGESDTTKRLVGSTVINRLNSGRTAEFGETINEIGQKGYYAMSKNSPLFSQAISKEFPDKKSEQAYKESLAIASGLLKGTIKPDKGLFYFKDDEVEALKKKGKKVFNFDQVKTIGRTGKYNVFEY